MDFEGFPKIPRLNREVVITEKIDGTNACVVISDDGKEIMAQSRSRVITPGNDNFGFAGWVQQHEDFLRELLSPGRHFGEWWGAGIQRRYDQSRKWFSLFNVARWKDLRDFDKAQDIGLSVVPIIPGDTLELVPQAVSFLRAVGSVAAPGFSDPEGVIVYHTAARTMFKVTCDNDASPKALVNGG